MRAVVSTLRHFHFKTVSNGAVMRSLFCMTAAMVLAAGVSAKADVVGMVNVPGNFTNSIKFSDFVVTSGVGDSASASFALLGVVDQGSMDASIDLGAVCLITELCGGSVSTVEANESSAVSTQAAVATRSAEPSSVALLGTGLLGFAAVMRRRFVA